MTEERGVYLWFLESLDRINRAMQVSGDLYQTMSHVLEAVLSVFGCDRAWLLYPCDPDAPSWKLVMEQTRPDYPGAFALGRVLPTDADTADVFRDALGTSDPVRRGAPPSPPIPAKFAVPFQIQSQLAMALHPKGDRPYLFGLHQCSHPRVWTSIEERLFQEVGHRLADLLTSLLMFRNLRESERRLEDAQRLAQVGYWDRDLVTGQVTLSDETCGIFGMLAEEEPVDLARWHNEWVALVHPEDRARVAEAAAVALEGGPRYDVEYRVVRRSGEVRFVHSRGNVSRDDAGRPLRMFGMMQDITERRRAERRLLAHQKVTQVLSEARSLEEAALRLLEAIGEGLDWDVGSLWRIDADQGELRALEVWCRPSVIAPRFEVVTRETGFQPGTGLPGNVWSTRAPIWIPDTAHDPSFVRGPFAASEGLHAALGFPIVLGDEVLGVLDLISREIRSPDPLMLRMLTHVGIQIGQFIERRRAEQALNDARAQLVHVTRVVTMGELAAAIAHEVKQPLTAVAMAAGTSQRYLARDPPDLGKARESLATISDEAQRAAAVIERIRSLVAKSVPAKSRVDVNETIREVLALAKAEADRHRIVVRTDLGPGLPPVLADRVQLEQVLLNLLVNGIHAMTAISERPRELRIESRQAGSEVTVAVEDRGVGVAPEMIDRIFEPFFTTKPDGMGMGLAISRRILELYGGRLWVSANDGGGASFQFALPCEPAAEQGVLT